MYDSRSNNPSPSGGDAFVARLLDITSGRARKRRNGVPLPPATDLNTTTAVADDAPQVVRVGFYSRYSSTLQDGGYSIDTQHDAAEQEAARRARHAGEVWQITWYDEPARTAKEEKLKHREVFLRMLRDAVDGRLDVVAVGRLDRLARALKVQLLVLDELQSAGVGFVAVREGVSYTTAMGRFVMAQMGAIAEFDNASKADVVRAAMVHRASTGKHNQSLPFGYRLEGGAAVPDVDVDDDARDELGRPLGMWHGLCEAFALMRLGMADEAIARTLNADGRWYISSPSRARRADGSTDRERIFTHTNIACIRRNRFYRPFAPGDDRGTIVFNGVEYRGQHVAAYTWDDWLAMQDMAVNKRVGWTAGHAPLAMPYTAEFRGLAVCADCGGRLYAKRFVTHRATSRDPDNVYVYEKYGCLTGRARQTCTSSRRYTLVEQVRALWVAWLTAHFAYADGWDARIGRYIAHQERHRAHGDSGSLDAKRAQGEQARLVEQQRRINAAYFEMRLSDDEYRERMRVVDAEMAALATRLTKPAAQRERELLDAAHLLTGLADLWQSPEITTDERVALATRLIRPGGMQVRLLPPTRKRTRWDTVDVGHAPTCELVSVALRQPYAELLKVTAIDTVA